LNRVYGKRRARKRLLKIFNAGKAGNFRATALPLVNGGHNALALVKPPRVNVIKRYFTVPERLA